jgi:hypothetical protein
VFLFRKPSDGTARRFLSSQKKLPFSYEEVGASRKAFLYLTACPGVPVPLM